MGYYAPTFANLSTLWFLSTQDNIRAERYIQDRGKYKSWWNDDCDRILEKYIIQYGCLLQAFSGEIGNEITSIIPSADTSGYFDYWLISLVLSNPKLKKKYMEHYNKQINRRLICQSCGKKDYYDNQHPDAVFFFRGVIPFCEYCSRLAMYVLCNVTGNKTMEYNESVLAEIKKVLSFHSCLVCNNSFKIDYDTLYSNGNPYSPGSDTPRLVKRLLFRDFPVCFDCIFATLEGNLTSESKLGLAKLKELSDYIGIIPSQSRSFILEQAKTSEELLTIILILKEIPNFEEMIEYYGSWLKVLIAADILDDGTRRMSFGTMCVALDGHDCFSLAEKTIDDLLFIHDIKHDKEPYYPESNKRADWEIEIDGNTVFIEYFGLFDIEDYRRRVDEKRHIARKHKIELIEFFPEDFSDIKEVFEVKVIKRFKD